MEFQVFHKYNRLVRRGLAEPLLCPNDDNRLVVAIGEDDEPMLHCYFCDTNIKPGLRLYERIRAIVSEYYV